MGIGDGTRVYDPLFETEFCDVPCRGLYDVSVAKLKIRLEELLVKPFDDQECRRLFLEHFFLFIEEIRLYGGTNVFFLELWIDGSFVTRKEKPGDIDIVIVCKVGKNVPAGLQAQTIRWCNVYGCDLTYVSTEKAKGICKEIFTANGNGKKGLVRICF